jgi:DNA-directed RNA polymerase subunit omega
MARVTVEDCKQLIPNHFELVVLASRRGRDISSGSPVLVEKSNDKNAVIALREIAAKKLNIGLLRDNLLNDYRKNVKKNDDLEDNRNENYIESDMDEDEASEDLFMQAFGDDVSNFKVEESFDEDEMSFEDEDLDAEE